MKLKTMLWYALQSSFSLRAALPGLDYDEQKHFLGGHPNSRLNEDKTKILTHRATDHLREPQTASSARFQPPDGTRAKREPTASRPGTKSANMSSQPTAKPQTPDETHRANSVPTPVPRDKGEAATTSPLKSNTAADGPGSVNQDTVTREMSMAEALKILHRHGCRDITERLDLLKLSEYPISSGGYGDVYRGAFHDGTPVAAKCLRLHLDSTDIAEKQLKRAARELYVWSKCDHPNVLALIGVGQCRNQLAMVSPWMEYGNVRHLLTLKPQADRYALCLQVTDGNTYLHNVGVVHGDLKGDNVLVSSDLVPKVTDFGNAALREYTLQFSKTTSRAGVSLNWVAPELLEEDAELTKEADVYSLGMTILEIISGSPPYAGMREPVIMRKILGSVHPVRPEEYIPKETKHADLLWSLLKSCWEPSPEDRPTSAEVRDEMKEVISQREKDMASGGEAEN